MINIINKTCIFYNCKKQPTFNYENKKQALYCFNHKLENMINIKSKRCLFENCTKHPAFNFENEKQALYCFNHKLENMIDIKNKKCIFNNCYTQPAFNYLHKKQALYCVNHKLDNMINVRTKKCCNCNFNYVSSQYKPYCFNCFEFLNPNDTRVRNFKTKEQAYMSEIQKVYPDIILDKKVEGGCSRRRPDGLIDCLTHSVIIEIDEMNISLMMIVVLIFE